MKKRYILPLISLGLSAYNPANAWDGVLLINQSNNDLTVFVDHAKSLDGVTLDIFDGIEKKTYNLVEYGGKLQAALQASERTGWVRLNKDGIAMASVKLDNFMNAPVAYIDRRDEVMEVARKGYTPTTLDEEVPTELASSSQVENKVEESVAVVDETASQSEVEVASSAKENAPQEDDIVASVDYAKGVAQVANTSDVVVRPEVDRNTNEKVEKKEETVAVEKTEAVAVKKSYSKSEFSHVIGDLIKEHDTHMSKAEQRDWIDYLTYDFNMLKKHDGWAELQDKKHKDEIYAYNGVDTFRYEEDKFSMTFSEDKDTQAFVQQNKVRLIPVSRRWMGIFFGDSFMGRLKWKKKFNIKANGMEELVVSDGKKDLVLKPNNQMAKK